jgi:hypothetical protein
VVAKNGFLSLLKTVEDIPVLTRFQELSNFVANLHGNIRSERSPPGSPGKSSSKPAQPLQVTNEMIAHFSVERLDFRPLWPQAKLEND